MYMCKYYIGTINDARETKTMTIGGTVKSMTETCGYVTVAVETDDNIQVRITLKADDDRVRGFGFRQQIMIEVNSLVDRPLKRIA